MEPCVEGEDFVTVGWGKLHALRFNLSVTRGVGNSRMASLVEAILKVYQPTVFLAFNDGQEGRHPRGQQPLLTWEILVEVSFHTHIPWGAHDMRTSVYLQMPSPWG